MPSGIKYRCLSYNFWHKLYHKMGNCCLHPRKWNTAESDYGNSSRVLTFNHTSVTSHKSKLVKSLFCLAVQASNPSWVKCPGMVIRYHSVETFPPNVTLDHCKQLCLSLPNCLCKSIDYRPSGGRCSPNNVSRLYAGTSWRMKAAYDFYEYTCLTEADLCSNSITATDSCGQKCLPDFPGQYGRHMSQTICNYKHRIILYQFDF